MINKGINKLRNLFYFVILGLLMIFFVGLLSYNFSEPTQANTYNETYTLVARALSQSPESYSSSVFETSNIDVNKYSKSPGTIQVKVEISKNGGGGCSVTSSEVTDVKTSADVAGTSYSHSGIAVSRSYEYKVTYIVKPNSGFQVYSAAGIRLLNDHGEDSLAGSLAGTITYSRALWTQSEQSTSYTFSVETDWGSNTVENEYIFFWTFAPVRYTVTYMVDNSTYSTKYVDYCANYSLPSAPSKVGYTFKGWYTKESGGDPITSSSIKTSASNETLYAQW